MAIIVDLEELAKHEPPNWFRHEVDEARVMWREIGHIPRERIDEIEDRFRAACDAILAAKIL